MDDLEVNPIYKALLTKFRREFDIACNMSYIIAIPHSDALDNFNIDQFLINSHILAPSKLLKFHYNPLQVGFCDDIELEGRRMICRNRKRTDIQIIRNILADEIGYNSKNKEYRMILIDRPLLASNRVYLIKNLLSPRQQVSSKKARKPLKCHDDCSKYLESISQDLTTTLEIEVKHLQCKYLVLPDYLDDAAGRILQLVDLYSPRYEIVIGNKICDKTRHAIRLSLENYIVHLLNGKLMAAIFNLHEKEDETLMSKFKEIDRSGLSICQLGAQQAFADFFLTEDCIAQINSLPFCKSPLDVVNSIMELIETISLILNESVKFRNLMGVDPTANKQVSICSDDLIASLVYSICRAKPTNLYSLATYLETFGWSCKAKDQAAYYTATFQIVIQYIFNYQSDQLECSRQSSERRNSKEYEENQQEYQVTIVNQFIDSLDSRKTQSDSSISSTPKSEWELL